MKKRRRVHSESHVFSRTKNPLTIVRGKDIYLYDSKGKRYIDASGGPIVVNIGHGRREIAEVMAKQAEKVAFVGGMFYANEPAIELAKKIADFSPGPLNNVFFVSGGSEGTETAIKMAHQYHLETGNPTKHKVISRWMSYHGSTLGALSVSGFAYRRRNFVPLLQNFPHIPPAYCYRCWYSKEYPECDLICAWELERTIKNEGAQHISAFIAEPIVGAALGCVPAPDGYFQIIREICDKHNVLFIADEVMTGFGRTGKNFGIDHWQVIPDIIVCAKGLSSGYSALGAVIATDDVYDAFETSPFRHGFTFGGIPISTATALAVLDYVVKHNLVTRSAKMGKRLSEKLERIKRHTSVGDIRGGKGLFAGVEFVADKKTKKPFDPSINFSNRLLAQSLKKGLMIYPIGQFLDDFSGDHVMIAPPFTVTTSQIDEIINLFDGSLSELENELRIS